MSSRYVEPRPLRHREQVVDGVQQLRLPVRRNWFVLAFLPFWLAGWTAGGVAAIKQVSEQADAFLVVWLCFWVVGWVVAASMLLAQLGGAEIVRVVAGDLEINRGTGPLSRTWRYRGGAIARLASNDPNASAIWGHQRLDTPFFLRPRSGAVKFSYGAETIYCASGVDEPEGRVITAWLAKRLPQSAAA